MARKKTYPLTIYEITRIIATRARQIAEGAKPFIEVPEGVTDPVEIAKLEFKAGKLPLIIRREYPDGTYEDIDIQKYIKQLK
ncbi:hypothetical protein DRO02_00760 [archaeon]|nr:MAG: hypothetical protein DRO02_00760 [archaeon]RLG66239.1 MAG: hypothetical protein DRO21_00215 [archaeon]RLG66291.1 MAG: hypothetical protein DRN89_01315 [archaeon]HDM24115.1 hypothetical protein [Candidatus Bathyarchaeota archaeon]